MTFFDLLVNNPECYSLGIQKEYGRYYVSIPVSNGLVDYEEYYEISEVDFLLFESDEAAVLNFVQKCRKRQNDRFLIIAPGKNRGTAI